MNTEHLHYLLTVAEYQSINQAANALNLQRPYLSRLVSNMEKDLGITIFERVPSGVVATEEGEYALQKIAEALAILEELAVHFTPQDPIYLRYHDRLTIYLPPKIRSRNQMMPITERYQASFPNVRLIWQEIEPAHFLEKIVGYGDAVALMAYSRQIETLHWVLPKNMYFVPLTQSALVALASANHPAASHYKNISLTTLCKQDLILMDREGTDEGFFYHLLSQYGKPQIKHIVSGNTKLFDDLMKTGRYFSIGVKNTLTDVDGLLQIPLKETIAITSGIVYDAKVLANVPAKALVETILAHFGKATN